MKQRVISLSVGDPIQDSTMECSYGMLRTPEFKRVSSSLCVVTRGFSMSCLGLTLCRVLWVLFGRLQIR